MALDVSTFVDISTSISVGGVPAGNFGRGLLLTIDPAIAAGGSGKAQLFNNLNEANAVLSAGAALDAATVWFSANPGPKGLWVGRWANVAVVTTLTAGAAPSAAGAAPLNAANAAFSLNGANVAADLSSAATYLAIATAIQAQIVAAGGVFTGATFLYDAVAARFRLTLAGADAINPPYFGAPTAGTDISAALGMASADSPRYLLGHAAETAVDALGELSALASGTVGVMLASDAPLTVGAVDTRTTVAAWAQAGDYIFGLKETAAQALVTNDVTSHMALAFSRNQGKVFVAFDNAGALPEVGALAFASSQNLGQPASIATVHAKPIPGVAASDITPTQYAEIERKRGNIVTFVGGIPRMVGGFTSQGGYWLDAQWWLLWLKNEMERGVWSAMGSSRRLTPGRLTDAVTEVLNIGVLNGGIQPGGTVNATTRADIVATTGNDDFDGTLATGYLLWVQRPSQATQVDRENRIGRFKAWLAPEPAIHKVLGDIILSG